MSSLPVHELRLAVAAASYFLSTLKTQKVRDEVRILEYEQLLHKLQFELGENSL